MNIFSVDYNLDHICSKTCVKQLLSKRPKIGFQDQLSLNAGQKYCRMLQGEQHTQQYFRPSLSYNFSLRFFFVYFEWQFYAGFTVCTCFSLALAYINIIYARFGLLSKPFEYKAARPSVQTLSKRLRKYQILCQPVSSADNLCKQFGIRSSPTKCWA